MQQRNTSSIRSYHPCPSLSKRHRDRHNRSRVTYITIRTQSGQCAETIESAAERNATMLSEVVPAADAMNALPNSEVSLSRAEDGLAVPEVAAESAALSARMYRTRYAEKRSNLTRWFYILTRMRRQPDEQISKAGEAYRGAIVTQSQAEQRRQALQQIFTVSQKSTPVSQTVRNDTVLRIRSSMSCILSSSLVRLPSFQTRKNSNAATI